MIKPVIGWDIGGAHVKAVMLGSHGHILQVTQHACALWKGLHLLEETLQQVLNRWQVDPEACEHAVTMTGELVDLFDNRLEGVRQIAATAIRYLPSARFYMADASLEAMFTDQIAGHEIAIASMNWHASAQCLATVTEISPMLVVDIGSTTSDFTMCLGQEVVPLGWTDAERMARNGLLYSGVVRTPLMALGPEIVWHGQPRHIAAEYFATTADVYRILGELPPEHDLADTADGQSKSLENSMRRLARMVGHDFADKDEREWSLLAQAFRTTQLQYLSQAIRSVISQSQLQPTTLVGLGAGSFLAKAVAEQLGVTYFPAATIMQAAHAQLKIDAKVCFPAYAVARLWQTWH